MEQGFNPHETHNNEAQSSIDHINTTQCSEDIADTALCLNVKGPGMKRLTDTTTLALESWSASTTLHDLDMCGRY